MTDEMSRGKSEFNMSLSFLTSISMLLFTCNVASVELDIYYWYHSLKALKRSIITEFSVNNLIEVGRMDEELKPLLSKHMKQNNKGVTKSVNQDLYDLLEEYQILIMKILKSSGMLLKIQDSPEFALGGNKDF